MALSERPIRRLHISHCCIRQGDRPQPCDHIGSAGRVWGRRHCQQSSRWSACGFYRESEADLHNADCPCTRSCVASMGWRNPLDSRTCAGYLGRCGLGASCPAAASFGRCSATQRASRARTKHFLHLFGDYHRRCDRSTRHPLFGAHHLGYLGASIVIISLVVTELASWRIRVAGVSQSVNKLATAQ